MASTFITHLTEHVQCAQHYFEAAYAHWLPACREESKLIKRGAILKQAVAQLSESVKNFRRKKNCLNKSGNRPADSLNVLLSCFYNLVTSLGSRSLQNRQSLRSWRLRDTRCWSRILNDGNLEICSTYSDSRTTPRTYGCLPCWMTRVGTAETP